MRSRRITLMAEPRSEDAGCPSECSHVAACYGRVGGRRWIIIGPCISGRSARGWCLPWLTVSPSPCGMYAAAAWSSSNSGRRAALAACDVKDDLLAGVPAFQDSVCLGGCLQREQVADDRLPGASVQQRREGPGAWPVFVLNQHAVEADVGIQQSVQIERPGGDGRDPARPVAAPSGQPRRACRRPRSAMVSIPAAAASWGRDVPTPPVTLARAGGRDRLGG